MTRNGAPHSLATIAVFFLGLGVVCRCLAHEAAVTTTIYVGKHFEVRDHDAPVKYIFNGSTRVARVTTNLTGNIRVQRLGVAPGWNLCSLAVTADNALSQLSTLDPQLIQAAYQWNPATSGWDAIAANQTLTAGAVLWLNATTNATLRVTGTYPGPSPNLRAPPEGAFLPGYGLEILPLLEVRADVSLWHFDHACREWQSTRPAPPVSLTNFPPVIAPGQAFYAQSPVSVDLELPDPALGLRYYHQDHLGSSSCLTDAQGNLVEETANYPFGHPRHQHQPKGLHEPYQFTQKERDTESGHQYFQARYLQAELSRWLSSDPLAVAEPALYLKRSPQAANLYSYANCNPMKFIDPTGLDSIIVVVGTDQKSGEHTHASASSFTKRVNTLLNTPTTEGIKQGINKEDRIYVVVPDSMDKSLVKELQAYGKDLPNYSVVQADKDGLVTLVNAQNDIKAFVFFGHGTKDAPIFDYGKWAMPDPSQFKASAFSPGARAIFATCNSMDYAQRFARETMVTSTGVEGTTFYGKKEISAGKLTPKSLPGTARSWTFPGLSDGKVQADESSLNQRSGTPFLRENP